MSSTIALEGIWQAISAVVDGEDLPLETVDSIRLTLTSDRFTTSRAGETLFDSAYTVDSDKSPNEIEMVGIGDFAGQPALGIYSLSGETLQICYRMPGFLRPTHFESGAGSGAFLITLKRRPSP